MVRKIKISLSINNQLNNFMKYLDNLITLAKTSCTRQKTVRYNKKTRGRDVSDYIFLIKVQKLMIDCFDIF